MDAKVLSAWEKKSKTMDRLKSLLPEESKLRTWPKAVMSSTSSKPSPELARAA